MKTCDNRKLFVLREHCGLNMPLVLFLALSLGLSPHAAYGLMDHARTRSPDKPVTTSRLSIQYEQGLINARILNTPLGEVGREFARKTGVRFALNDPVLANRPISTVFKGLPLREGIREILTGFSYAISPAAETGRLEVRVLAALGEPAPSSPAQVHQHPLPDYPGHEVEAVEMNDPEAPAPVAQAEPQWPSDPKPKFRRVKEAIKGRYNVVLKKDVPKAEVSSTADQMAFTHGGKIRHKYRHALKGFATEMSEAEAQKLSEDPLVEFVEEDGVVHGDASTVQETPTWGLDRIDQRILPVDNTYSYNGSGFGVNAYVIDSGIRATHQEFAGRVAAVRDFMGGGGVDCHGHGTHVAGILGGSTFGVAKHVRIHSLRVLDCTNQGAWSDVIEAVDWVRANYVKPAVVNMSLGGGVSSGTDTAVQNLIAAGVSVVVSAGNGNVNADTQSPARVTEAITVGATDNTDTRPTNWQCPGSPTVFTCGSNFGTVVDVFAPGNNITSAWIGSDTVNNAQGGTSMAAPHVAGMVARYLESDPEAPPFAVESLITRNATLGVVTNEGNGSPNRLLYTLLPTPKDRPRFNGDFDGDGRADILVQSPWGIGILTYNGSSVTTLMAQPNGSWFGDWFYDVPRNHIVAVGNFTQGDRQTDLLITSHWGIGILTFDPVQKSLKTVMLAPNGTSLGGWTFNSPGDRITGTVDLDGNGQHEIVVTSSWGIGILKFNGSTLTPLVLASNGTQFGNGESGRAYKYWQFDSTRDRLGIYGDFDGKGGEDILVRSPWGMGILGFNGTTLTSLMMASNGTRFSDGTRFGGWTYNSKTDRIAGVGNFKGESGNIQKAEILVTNKSGLAILSCDASFFGFGCTSLTAASNGKRLGGWLLDTKANYIGRIGDVNGNLQDDIIIRSDWGMGIFSLNGSSLTPLWSAPNGPLPGGWNYQSSRDEIAGVGNFSRSPADTLLVASGWGMGILHYSGASLDTLTLAPNGTPLGSWLLHTPVDQFGIYGDLY